MRRRRPIEFDGPARRGKTRMRRDGVPYPRPHASRSRDAPGRERRLCERLEMLVVMLISRARSATSQNEAATVPTVQLGSDHEADSRCAHQATEPRRINNAYTHDCRSMPARSVSERLFRTERSHSKPW